MNSHLKYIVVFLILFSCKSNKEQQEVALTKSETHLTIAFGSCNRQTFDNKLWDPIAENDPTVWIWGGDVIYSDTDNMELMQEHYDYLPRMHMNVEQFVGGYETHEKKYNM